MSSDAAARPACDATEGCITCGDVAVPLTVMSVFGPDARCRDDQGREESVATELIGPVFPGQRLLVHAGVAIGRLDDPPPGDTPHGSTPHGNPPHGNPPRGNPAPGEAGCDPEEDR